MQFDCVAQLTISLASGKTRVGSGYLVADRLLLTAGHVVDEMAAKAVIEAAFPAVQGTARGVLAWSGRAHGLDAALVELPEAPQAPVRLRVRPVRWGRLTGQRPGVTATAMGFPRVLKDDDGSRVPDQVDGTINPGTGFGSRYDVQLSGAHPLVQANDPSPWGGLSGAALFSDEFICGVIVIDTPNFQSGRLTAVPAWRLLENHDFVHALARHGCAVEWESVELAELFDRPPRWVESPASLLRADMAFVRFRGREQLLDDLRQWADSSDPLAARLIVGAGGQGKSRLALELCKRLRSRSWITGEVRRNWDTGMAAGRLADSRLPVLAVIDYAETRDEQIRQLVEAAAEPSERVRLLLLARSAGEWWQELLSRLRYRLRVSPPVALAPLEDTPEGRSDAYSEAVRDLSSALQRLPTHSGVGSLAQAPPLKAPDLSAQAYAAVLTIHLRALTDLLECGGHDVKRVDHADADGYGDPERLEDLLLEHEQEYWRQTAAREGFVRPEYQFETLQRSVAAATLCGAADENEATLIVTRIPGLTEKTSDEQRGAARWLHELYPASAGQYWGALQPDRVGEHLIGRVTYQEPDLVSVLVNGATETQQTLALTVLARSVVHQPHMRGILRDLLSAHLRLLGRLAIPVALSSTHPAPLIDALSSAVRATTDVTALDALNNVLPVQSIVLAQFAADVSGRLVVLSRDLAEAWPVFLPELASTLTTYTARLRDIGRPQQALDAIEEAVHLYRDLSQEDPARYLPALAASLNNYSLSLSDFGRVHEAVMAGEEAVTIRRRLASERPTIFLPELAKSLNNQAARFSEAGQPDQALTAITEAVVIYRQLAEKDRASYQAYVARALVNQANSQIQLGRPIEALAATDAATEMYRPLANEHPDVYRRDLTAALVTHSHALSALGRRDEALAAIDEAVILRRVLVDQQPNALLPALASALIHQFACLIELARLELALAAIDEASTIYRQLGHENPGAFLPDLAMCCANRYLALQGLGRPEPALAAIHEAAELYRHLSQERSDTFLPQLARSLDAESALLRQLGQRQPARAAIDEAVSIYRTLARDRPDVYLPVLASDLNDHASMLADQGFHLQALALMRDAVAIYRQLAQEREHFYFDRLAGSLHNQARLEYQLGQREPALATIDEAVRIYRELAERDGEETMFWRAGALHTQSVQLAEAGLLDPACAVAEEALAVAVPVLERTPRALPDSGMFLLNMYLRLCKEVGRDPNIELVERTQRMLLTAAVQAPHE